MRFVIGLGVALLPACMSSLDTGTVENPIVGGTRTTSAMWPTVVALENTPSNWFCTGTLIDKDWVLTAAHCVEGETAAGLNIRFDDDNINDTTGGKVVKVSEIHANPGYDGVAWDNDIALIKLATSVTDREPTPVHRTMVPFGTAITIVGYGDADNNGGGAGVLRQLDEAALDCGTTGDATLSNANVLCFDAADGAASCYGDSGGPGYMTINGKLEVAGVTSGGTQDSCTQGFDIYTSVPGEIDFVDSTMAMTPPDPNPNPNPDPDPNPNPDPDPNNPKDDGGGCNTGGGSGGLLLVGLALLLVRRR